MSKGAKEKRMKRLGVRLGIEDVCPHRLLHTFATYQPWRAPRPPSSPGFSETRAWPPAKFVKVVAGDVIEMQTLLQEYESRQWYSIPEITGDSSIYICSASPVFGELCIP